MSSNKRNPARKVFGIFWRQKQAISSSEQHRQEEKLSYAAESGEQGFADTTQSKNAILSGGIFIIIRCCRLLHTATNESRRNIFSDVSAADIFFRK